MKLTKEIEERKKNEENMAQSLKDKYEECNRVNSRFIQLEIELQQSKNNEQELER